MRSFQRQISILGENGTGHFPDVSLILHNQDRLGSTELLFCRFQVLPLLSQLAVDSGKINLKSRSAARLAIYLYPAATLGNYAIHRRQPEARPFSGLLGGKKW